MAKDLREAKFIKMTTENVWKLLGQMALPSIVSMLVSAVYNMVDTMFVGRISTEATAGVGVVFSYMSLIQALAFFFGHGAANYVSRALGRKDTENAAEVAATGFFSTLLLGVALCILCNLFMNPILRFLGATDTILSESRDYFFFILLGTPFIMCSYALNLHMRLQGNANVAMVGIASGAILNCLLDPLFIFTLGLGVKGAAAATALSQLLSFVLLLSLTGFNGGIRIRLSAFRPKGWHYREIAAGGFPSLARQGLGSVATICLNRIAGFYGDAVLAAFSVVSKTLMFSLSAVLGFGQGFQPVCGFNYGAKKYDRVRKAFWASTLVSTVYCTIMAVVGLCFAPQIIAFFRNDPVVVQYGSRVLRYQCLSYPLVGFTIITNMYLQNIRKTLPASVIAMSRQGILFIPTLFVLNAAVGLEGILFAQAIADALTVILCIPIALGQLNAMGKEA